MYEGEELVQVAKKNLIKEDVPVEPVAPTFPDANRSNVYDNAAKALGITPEELKADPRIVDAVEHTSDLIDKREEDALPEFMGEEGTTRLYSALTDSIAKHYELTKNNELYEPKPLGREDNDLLEKARAGGATISPLTRRNRLQGWAVAVRGNNDEIIDTVALENGIGDLIMNDYVNRNIDKFGGNKYLGLWHDKNSHELVFDVSEVFKETDVEAATKAGQDRNQKAIFNLKTWKEIDTGGTGDNGRARKERESARLGGDKSRGVEEPEPARADSADEERTPVSDSGVDRARAEDEAGLSENLRELPSYLRDNLEIIPSGLYASEKKSIAENIDRLENSLDKGSSAITDALKALSRSLARAEKKQEEQDAKNTEVADLLDETIMQVSLAHNYAKSIVVAPSAPGQPEGRLTQPGSASSRRIAPSSDGSELLSDPMRMARESGSGSDDSISDLADIVDDTDPEIIKSLRALDLTVDYDSLSESQKKTYNNLKSFQEKAVRALSMAAASDNMDKYKRVRTIALSVTRAYNSFITAINTNNPEEDYISTGSMSDRLKNLTIIDDSVVKMIGRDTRTEIIKKAKALWVGRDGTVYEIGIDGHNEQIEIRELDPSGNYVTKSWRGGANNEVVGFLNQYGASDGFHTEHADDLLPYAPNSKKIIPVSPGMIKNYDPVSVGVAGALYTFLGYLHSGNGRGFMHSTHLLKDGNRASKLTNKSLTYHHPAQREKALTIINPNSDIIQAMADAGWFARGYKAHTTITDYPGNHDSLDSYNEKITFNKFLTPLGTYEGGDNIGPLWNLDKSVHSIAEEIETSGLMDSPDVANYFKSYFDGNKEDWESINIQGTLLDTAFLDGTTKEDALAKLRSLQKASDVISKDARSSAATKKTARELYAELGSLIAAVDARSFDDSTRVERPKDMDFAEISKTTSDPFEAKNGFEPFRTDFILPEGVSPIDSSTGYNPKRSYPSEWINSSETIPPAWTDEPGQLELQPDDRLIDGLRQSIKNKSDLGVIEFNGIELNVQARSIYDAMRRKRLDHNMILAQLYDEVLGGDENQRRLEEHRKTARSLKSEAAELMEAVGIVVPPADFEFGGMYDEKSDKVLSGPTVYDDETTGEGFGLQLSKLSRNEKLMTVGGGIIDQSPYETTDTISTWSARGVTDNPRIIARNFSRSGLSQALVSAVKNGRRLVSLKFANGSEKTVNIRAIRDALQHQGVDTNALLKSAGATRRREYMSDVNVADNGERKTTTFKVSGENGFLRVNSYADPASQSNGRATVIIDDPNGTDYGSLGSGSKVIGLTRLDNDPRQPYAVVWFGRKDAVALSRFDPTEHDSKIVERFSTREEADAVLSNLAKDDAFVTEHFVAEAEGVPLLNITKRIPSTLPTESRGPLGSKTISHQIGIVDPKVVHFVDTSSAGGVVGGPESDSDKFVDDNGNILGTVTKTEDGNFHASITTGGAGTKEETFNDRQAAQNWAGEAIARQLDAKLNLANSVPLAKEASLVELYGYKEKETLENELSKSVIGTLTYNDGSVRKVTVTSKKAKATPYRRAEPDYVLVSMRVTDPTKETGKFSLSISRIGRSEWYLSAAGKENHSTAFSSPGDALRAAREIAKRNIGQDLIPDFTAIGYKDTVDAPVSSLRSEGDIDGILAHASEVVDSTGAVELSGLGGVNGARKVKLSDGRIFKRKGASVPPRSFTPEELRKEESRRIDSEVFAHAVYALAGIQATRAQKGKDGEKPVIMDPWVETDSSRNWMRITTASGSGVQIGEDVQRGFVLDAVFDNRDVAGNSGNIIVGTDGRAYRCDMGGAGLWKAGGDRGMRTSTFQPDDSGSSIDYFMPTSSRGGSGLYKGMTDEKRRQYVIDHLAPLTDEALEKLGSLIENDEDRKKTLDTLKSRRDGILKKLGIDIEEERRKRAESSKAEPEVLEEGEEETITDGFTPVVIEPTPAESEVEKTGGPKKVKISELMSVKRTPDGVFYPENHSDLYPYSEKIRKGEIVPEELPFSFRQPLPAIDADGMFVRTPPSYVDANGIYRTSAFGTFNTFIRRKNADGTYSVLGFGRGIGGREVLGGLIEDRGSYSHDADAGHLSAVLASGDHGLKSKTPVTHEVELAPGYKSRVSIYDLSEDEARDLDLANERLLPETDGGRYRNREWMSQNDFLDRISDPEWTANPDNLSGLRAIFSLPTSPTPRSKPIGVSKSEDEDIEVIEMGTVAWSRDHTVGGKTYSVTKLTNGTYSITDSTGKTIAEVRPSKGLYQFEAYILPNNIGTPGNPGARLAFFNDETQAKAWAGDMATDDLIGGDRNLFLDYPVHEAGYGDAPVVVHKGGHLDKATEDQISTLTRLVNTKEMVGVTRAKYREHLTKPNLVKGEVGSLIRELSRLEDRSDDVTASERDGASVPPAKPTDGGIVPPKGPSGDESIPTSPFIKKKASELLPGDKIVDAKGNYIGKVAVTYVDKENGKVTVAMIDKTGASVNLEEALLEDEYTVDPRVPAAVGAKDEKGGGAGAGDTTALPGGVVAFRARSSYIIDQVKTAYPAHTQLPNGDLVIAEREYTERSRLRRTFKYQVVVHRLPNERFVAYAREVLLKSDGSIDPTYTPRAGRVTPQTHSPLALLNDIPPLLNGDGPEQGILKRNPRQWLSNSGDLQNEVVNPATGQLLPETLSPKVGEKFIGDTGIKTTGDGVKDALIGYITELVDRGVKGEDILSRLTSGRQTALNKEQVIDLIERIEANRNFPGVNAIPYVSRDNASIVRIGDKVRHYSPTGRIKEGVVMDRIQLVINRKPSGEYEYTDKVWVQFPGRAGWTEITTRNLEVLKRKDGSDPLPAIDAETGESLTPSAPSTSTSDTTPPPPAVPESPTTPPSEGPADDFATALDYISRDSIFNDKHIDLINRGDAPEEFKIPDGYRATISMGGEGLTLEHIDKPFDNLNATAFRKEDGSWEIKVNRPSGRMVTIPPIYANRSASDPIEALKMLNSDLKNARKGAPHDGMSLEDRMRDLTNNDRFLEDMHTYLFTDESLPTELRNRYKLPSGYSAVRRTSSGSYGSVFISKKDADGNIDPNSPMAEISLVRDGERTIAVWANDADRNAGITVFSGRTALDPEHAIAMVSSDLRSAIQGRPARDIKQYKDLGVPATPEAPAPAEAPEPAPATPATPSVPASLPEGYTVRGGEGDAPTIVRSNDMSKPYMRIEKATDENGNEVFKAKAWNTGKDALDDLAPAEEKDFTDREKAMQWANRRANDPSRIGKPDEPETKWETDADGREILSVTGVEGSEDDSNPAALITDVPGVGTLGAVYSKKSGIGGTPFEVRTFRSREEAKDWANGLINGELEKFKNGEESELFKKTETSVARDPNMPDVSPEMIDRYLSAPGVFKEFGGDANVSERDIELLREYDPSGEFGKLRDYDARALQELINAEADAIPFDTAVFDAPTIRKFRESYKTKKLNQIRNYVSRVNGRARAVIEIGKNHSGAERQQQLDNLRYAENRILDRMSRARLGYNISLSALRKVVSDPDPAQRRFKNQFETRTTRGHDAHYSDPLGMSRRGPELEFGNVPLDTSAENRPKYGFPLNEGVNGIGDVTDFEGPEDVIGHRKATPGLVRELDRALNRAMDNSTAGHYGEITVVFKDEVKSRTTMTAFDSLGASVVSAPMDNLTRESLWAAGIKDNIISVNRDGKITAGGFSYAEIQMHGLLGLDDVEAIYAPSVASKEEIESLLRSLGIGIEVKVKSRT